MTRHKMSVSLVLKYRNFVLTLLLTTVASGVEFTAFRRIDRTWNITLQKNPLALLVACVRGRNRRKQRIRVREAVFGQMKNNMNYKRFT